MIYTQTNYTKNIIHTHRIYKFLYILNHYIKNTPVSLMTTYPYHIWLTVIEHK